MSIEIQCMTEKLIVITIKLDYSKVPSKSTVPTYKSQYDFISSIYYPDSQESVGGSVHRLYHSIYVTTN